MAKSKKNDGSGVLVFAIVILVFFILVTPLVAILFYLYCKYAESRKVNFLQNSEKTNNSPPSFWLKNEEKIAFKAKIRTLLQIETVLKAATQKGIDANLKINKDGSFSARSKQGKAIRAIYNKYEPLKERTKSEILIMKSIPQNRWKDYYADIAQVKESLIKNILWKKISMTIFLSCLISLPVIYFFTTLEKAYFFASIISIISGVIAYFACIGNDNNDEGIFEIPSPPPLVSIKNIDKY